MGGKTVNNEQRWDTFEHILEYAPLSELAVKTKLLRKKSGAGMMDCKKALLECNGDMDAAFEHLRNMPWPPRHILVR